MLSLLRYSKTQPKHNVSVPIDIPVSLAGITLDIPVSLAGITLDILVSLAGITLDIPVSLAGITHHPFHLKRITSLTR